MPKYEDRWGAGRVRTDVKFSTKIRECMKRRADDMPIKKLKKCPNLRIYFMNKDWLEGWRDSGYIGNLDLI